MIKYSHQLQVVLCKIVERVGFKVSRERPDRRAGGAS